MTFRKVVTHMAVCDLCGNTWGYDSNSPEEAKEKVVLGGWKFVEPDYFFCTHHHDKSEYEAAQAAIDNGTFVKRWI